MEMVSKVHAKNLVKWAKDRPKVLVLSADLTSSCEADLFRDLDDGLEPGGLGDLDVARDGFNWLHGHDG